MRHSQNNEEDIILGYFGDKVGRFLDMGANDGATLSNTRALALRGWDGVLVEPSPTAFARLSALYPDGKTLLNLAVGDREGEIEFFEHGSDTLVSTTVAGERDRWGLSNYLPVKARMVGVDKLLELAPGPYNFVSIDCEGMDVAILSGLAPRMTPSVVYCIEHNSVEERKRQILSLLPNHKVICFNAENFILAPT